MQEHILIALAIRRGLEIARAAALDLHSATSFLLYVLHVRTAGADDLGAQVEARNRIQADGDLGLGPLAPSELISFHLLLVAASESAFVHKIGQLLLHHLFNLGNRLLEAGLRSARDVEVKRGVLATNVSLKPGDACNVEYIPLP